MIRVVTTLAACCLAVSCARLQQGVRGVVGGVKSTATSATLTVSGLPWSEAKQYGDWVENRGGGPWMWNGDTLLAMIGHKPDLLHRQTMIQEALRRGLLTQKDMPVVQSRTIGVGVNKRAVTAAWGRATHVHRADGPGGWQESWEYRGERGGVAWVYFDRKGNVARWQQVH